MQVENVSQQSFIRNCYAGYLAQSVLLGVPKF